MFKHFCLLQIVILTIAAALLGQSSKAIAQERTGDKHQYKAFKVDLMIGAPVTLSRAVDGFGLSASVEPHYALNDRFSLGLECQISMFFTTPPVSYAPGQKPFIDYGSCEYERYISSYSITSDYYLKNKNFRPFIGAGAGLNFQARDGLPFYTKPVTSQFAVFPRIGVETGHFRLVASYYLLAGMESYLSSKAGFFFGGGKRKSKDK